MNNNNLKPYVEFIAIDGELDKICKRWNLYTLGEKREYDNLIEFAEYNILFLEDIIEIAKDIENHTDFDKSEINLTTSILDVVADCFMHQIAYYD